MTNPDPRECRAAQISAAPGVSRRDALRRAAAVAGGVALLGAGRARAAETPAEEAADDGRVVKNGRIRQSFVQWCYSSLGTERLIEEAAKMGVASVELISPEHWPLLEKHGLVCAISSSHGFRRGLNHPDDHEFCLGKLREMIDLTSAAGFPSVITFSGMKRDIPDDVGLDNAVKAVKQIIGHAEKKKVTICLEMLNTRDDSHPMKGHPGYQCDDLDWAVELCDRVASERMKILFDIYHVQIMHGDVIRRIRQISDYIGHYHTAGVPGRGELDATQELQYAPIMKAIVETGYEGYVGQEFIPTRDPIAGLREAVALCDV